ncbi:uncharacterized protein LOC144646136 [Oculina patagonica]
MKVICAGLSKTGTTSIAKALRILGYEVYDFMEHITIHHDEWSSIYRLGKQPDFLSMYKDVDAVTDLPTAVWYEEIYQAFPDAKVILSVRDSEEVWVESRAKMRAALYHAGFLKKMVFYHIIPYTKGLDPSLADEMAMSAYGPLRPESTVLHKKKYREHNERVQAVIPKEKLLVFNVKQGWKPLCEFLGCEIPDQEFPRANVAGAKDSTVNRFTSIINDVRNKFFIIFAVFAFLASALYVMSQSF